jgi:lactate dehydrogenase-like 2-hydroxyacid dehydrogenase
MGFTLRNKVIGLYGFGKIARETAKIAKHGFGMDVIFYDPFVDENCDEWRKVESLEQLFREARVVSIHTLLSDHTKNSVNADILKHAKGVILINTARGPIVNTEDALRALDEGKLSGIGADVAGDNDSYANLPVRDDIVFTQHTGFFTEEAVASIIRQTFENLHNPRIENVL